MENSFLNSEDVEALRGYIYIGNSNIFSKVRNEEIETAEKVLGQPFPNQLKIFYQEIGSGNIIEPHIVPENYQFYSSNEILPPIVAANFSKGILEWENQTHWMSESTYELLEPGDLPFFEMYDSSYFLLMKLNSDNPNAVWYNKNKVTDSFEEFIWRLYYESPSFYGQYMG